MAMENGKTTMQKDDRPFEERYAEFKTSVGKRFKEAHQKNEAFYQLKPDFIKAPVAGLAGKDGKRHPFQKENAAILMQAALDKGIEDTRWISAKQLNDNNLFVKKGETATVLVARNAKTHEPNRMVSYFNVAQLAESSQKKVPEAGSSRFRDSIAKKMAEYLKENIPSARELIFLRSSRRLPSMVTRKRRKSTASGLTSVSPLLMRSICRNPPILPKRN